MATIDEVKAQLRVLTDAINSLESTVVPVVAPEDEEVDIKRTDGSIATYVPKQ